MKRMSWDTYRFRKIIIVVWLLALIILSVCAANLPKILQGDGFTTNGTYEKVQDLLGKDFKYQKSTLVLLFEKQPNIREKEYHSYIKETLHNIKSTKGLVDIKSPLENSQQIKGNYAYAILCFNKDFKQMSPAISELKLKIKHQKYINTGLTGAALVNEDLNTASQSDLEKAERIGLPIALIVLLFAFGGLVAALIPIMIGMISVVSSMGILFIIGQRLDFSIFVLNVVPMIGLALGIDFSLLFINRFREEMHDNNVQEAIAKTVKTAGRSIGFSGLCVLLGLSGMLFIQVDIFKTVAISGMIVVFVSVLSSLTLLPALLAVIGKNINRFMVLNAKENRKNKWHSYAEFVMKRPVQMAILGFTVLIVGLIPITNLKLSIPDAASLPKNYETRTIYETYQKEFAGKNHSEIEMIADTNETITSKDSLHELESIITKMKKAKIVTGVDSIFSLTGNLTSEQFYDTIQNPQEKTRVQPVLNKYINGHKTILIVHLNVRFDSEKAKNFARKWNGRIDHVDVMAGGLPKFNQEIFDEIFHKLGYCLAVAFASTFIILMAAFRSIIIPLKAIIMNMMSLSATFGILVLLFQNGMFGFEKFDSIGIMIPVFIFGIVFGLSMDYEVFLLSRIHEIYEKTKDNNHATLEGLSSTSKIISSAALIMIVVTGAFAFTGVAPIKQLGTGIALSIFIDATIVRMVIIPSLMKLLGELNWWFPKGFKKKVKLIKYSPNKNIGF